MKLPIDEHIPSEDWMEKNYRTQSELDKANMRMAGKIVPDDESEEDIKEDHEIIESNGVLLHKRTQEDYISIKETFLREAESEFKQMMGYGQDEIERIGWQKFIDAYDWPDAASVFSWKTDVIHIIPCAHCNNEFATFEMDMGLCPACTELYDLEFFTILSEDSIASLNEESIKNGGGEISANAATKSSIAAFVYDPEFRKKFLKSNLCEGEDENKLVPKDLLSTKWDTTDPQSE